MSTYHILIVIMILGLIGVLPAWPYSAAWGYYPTGLIAIIVIILASRILMAGT